MPSNDNQHWSEVLFWTALLLGVFVLDVATPLGTAVGVLYVLPVLGTVRRGPTGTLGVAGIAIGLTLLGLLISPRGSVPQVVLVNRGLSVLSIGVSTLLVLRATAAQRAALELQRNKQRRLLQILDTSPVAMIVLSPDGVVEAVNRGACTLFGASAAALTGSAVAEHHHCPTREAAPLRLGPAGCLTDGTGALRHTDQEPGLGRVELSAVPDRFIAEQGEDHRHYGPDPARAPRGGAQLRPTEAPGVPVDSDPVHREHPPRAFDRGVEHVVAAAGLGD